MKLNTLQVRLLMLLRENDKSTGYQLEKRFTESHQIIYRSLNQLKDNRIIDFIKVPNDSKPPSIFYSHHLSDEELRELISGYFRDMLITTKHGVSEVAAACACCGFVGSSVIAEWANNFIEFQKSILKYSESNAEKYGCLSGTDIGYRQYLIQEVTKIIEPF